MNGGDSKVEKEMNKIPQIDSIADVARFWDTHDLTDFEHELEEVKEPVFESGNILRIALPRDDAAALHREAESRGVEDTELVREWLSEKLHAV